jgi:hypothetical protein
MANGLERENRVPIKNRVTVPHCAAVALAGIVLNVGVRGFLMYSSGPKHEIFSIVLLAAIVATALSCVGIVAVGVKRVHLDGVWAAGPFLAYVLTFVATSFVSFYWPMAFTNLHTYYPPWLR